ncbi:hypothetical protein GQ44DRAFT_619162 [Phaeosphaeriaceae sp. PMI808]|nr:hypothetical protein GQ44DRAFT_619162 [Phaeosphaeriaceae sp. PMI808]
MPKQRLTCTRCSQRRQKCDRKSPCSRCTQHKEAHLCTTQWGQGYNPSIHRRYPRKPSLTGQSADGSSDISLVLVESTSDLQLEQSDATSNSTAPSLNITTNGPIAEPRFSVGETTFPDITIVSLLNEKDTTARGSSLFDQGLKYLGEPGKVNENPNRGVSFCSSAAKTMEQQQIQALLPSKETVLLLVDYHRENMLYWMGGLYHGPSFREKLTAAYGQSSTLHLERLDWRWNGLLFAILSSSIISCPEALSLTWGYSIDEKVRFSRNWGAASVSCLNLGNYLCQYHICTIQAIYILHALGPHPEDENISSLNVEQKQAFFDREIGRRVWGTMVTQEWYVPLL